MSSRFFLGFSLFCGLACGAGAAAVVSPEIEFFERKVRPVLVEHCYECHSAESKAVRGGLRVDSREGLLRGGDTGPAVVPGKPTASLLVKAIAHGDPDLAMPPKKPKLSEAILADVGRWIADGAVWPAASAATSKSSLFDLEARKRAAPWMWETPKPQPVPAVRNSGWPRSPLDHFILHPLEEKGLAPAAPVDDRTWLRRVHFAITGLPPTRAELQEFLSDPTPAARERVVDRLLSSPHFGERWARHWMDLVRYAESRGHEGDYDIANAWHYRDYLIRAFNAGVPYNQFLLEHLAGDLVPQPRLKPGTDHNESVLGTGWAFLGEEVHSPVDIRQDECDRLDNKVDVFTKTFLGLTVACARCHDHKFDPIRAQDYYALSGFMLSSNYRQVRFEAMENNRKRAGELAQLRSRFRPQLARATVADVRPGLPQIPAYLEAAAAQLVRLKETNSPGNAATTVSAEGGDLHPDRLRLWVAQLQTAVTNSAHLLHPYAKATGSPAPASPAPTSRELAASTFPPNARVIADFTQPGRTPWKADGEAFGAGPVQAGELVLGSGATNALTRVMTYGAARRDPFWNRLTTTAGNENDSGELGATARAGKMLRTPTVTLGDGHLHYLIRGRARVYAAVDSHLMVLGPLHGVLVRKFDTGTATEPQWVTHDLSPYPGHRTHIEFGPEGDSELEVLMVVESPEVPKWKPGTGFSLTGQSIPSRAEFSLALQRTASEAIEWLQRNDGTPANERIAPVANWLVQNPGLFGNPTSGALAPVADEFARAEQDLGQRVTWASRTAVAWFDGTGVDENVLVRGKPFKNGPLAPRSLPAAFPSSHSITNPTSSGRYELGLQLTDPTNPLVARVMVNRVWHHLFGRGLVPTVDNFGALGERPTHPELLDQLAWQFIHEDGWSVKRLIKRLTLTQTYAMGHTAADARAAQLDPSNNFWHRVPVRRLEAEAIRDSLLAVSGRLNSEVGGPPIPVHLTEFVIGRGRPEKSGPMDGNGRRSLYTAVRRNFLPTEMLTFDSPTPFSTVGRRNRTNVPAQSLALMNDPLFHQQSRLWAERLLRELPDADSNARLAWLFESAFGRPPTAAELDACQSSLADLRQFRGPDNNGVELWTDLCHALLNANDFIYVM